MSAEALEADLRRTLRAYKGLLADTFVAWRLTPSQESAMRHLARHGERRMSELSAHLRLTGSATTSLVERLEARGYVSRRASAEDRRGVTVRLTESGKALLGETHDALMRALEAALAALSVPERHMAMGGLHALADALEARLAGGADPAETAQAAGRSA